MNTNQLIRVVVASGLIAAIGCADGQRSSNGAAGKGKKMNKAFDPSTNLVNGRPSKTADAANDAQADKEIEAVEADLKVGTELDAFPNGSFRLASSVTIYKLNDTNERVRAGSKTVYGADDRFTPNVEDMVPGGKFKSTVDKGLNLGIPMTFTAASKKIQTGTAALLNTKVVNSPTKIAIVEALDDVTEANAKSLDVSVGSLLEKGSEKSADGKIVASAKLLQIMNDGVRIVIQVEELQGDAIRVNRNIYLTYKLTGPVASEGAVSPGSGAQAAATTPGQKGGDGSSGASDDVDATPAAAGPKTK